MLCWKKASYNKKTTSNNSNNTNNSKSNVQLTSFKRLQSVRKNKDSPNTIRFKSNLR